MLHGSRMHERGLSACNWQQVRLCRRRAIVKRDVGLPMPLSLASANVSTLHPKELRSSAGVQGCHSTGRMQYLDRMFAQAKIDVACVQEGRLPGDGDSECVNFKMYRAGASKQGCGGVQVWLSHRLASFVSATVVRSPWIMRVVLTLSCMHLHIISAHAPFESDSETRKHVFWDQLTAELVEICRDSSAYMFLGIDANAHVGTIPSSSVGKHGVQKENDNGSLFRSLLEDSGLFAVNTFFNAGPTWTGSTGKRSRIDYVCASMSLKPFFKRCCICEDIDLSTSERDDHSVVLARLEAFPTSQCNVSDIDSRYEKNEKNVSKEPQKKQKKAVGNSAEDRLGAAASSLNFDSDSIPHFGSNLALRAIHSSQCRARYTKDSLMDPARIAYFQRLMSEFCFDGERANDRASACCGLDVATTKLVHYYKWAASQAFIPVQSSPNKSWVSERSWGLMQTVSSLRRYLKKVFRRIELARCEQAFRAWQVSCRSRCVRAYFLSGEQAVQHCQAKLRFCFVRVAVSLHILPRIVKMKRPMLAYDRRVALMLTAVKAQKAADRNDSKLVFSIVKGLAGKDASPLKGIRNAAEELLTDEARSRDRWRSHFAELFKARIIDEVCPTCFGTQTFAANDIVLGRFSFRPSTSMVYKALMSLNGEKGLGPDFLSASVLQAGGWQSAVLIHHILMRIVDLEYVPVVWRGGRLITLYKGKGPTSDVDSYRGLLISDHIGKVLTTLLQWAINDLYVDQVGSSQYGAVPGRSTALASLSLRSFLDLCKLKNWSCFVLFVDLSKAFDYAIREVVMGWTPDAPTNAAAREAFLTELGIPSEFTHFITSLIDDDGHLLSQMGVDEICARIINSLHNGNSFQLTGDERAIVTRTGGRQGCKLGAVVFNLI